MSETPARSKAAQAVYDALIQTQTTLTPVARNVDGSPQVCLVVEQMGARIGTLFPLKFGAGWAAYDKYDFWIGTHDTQADAIAAVITAHDTRPHQEHQNYGITLPACETEA